MELKIEYVKKEDLKPYAKNAKKHPKEQVEHIANSIRQFGFRQPIVVDRDNVVVIGHGRLLASKKLGLPEVPIVRADDLTEEQIKALRLADNKTNESDWDEGFLMDDLGEIFDIDMSDFGFDLDLGDDVTEDDSRLNRLKYNVFENQERRQFYTENYYGIPSMRPTQTVGDKFMRFCDCKDFASCGEYIAHFYYDDFKFIQAWKNPDKYIDRLKKFKAVIAPDFSLYTDFPRALQILSCYRRQWCGAYWQDKGIDVIPDVIWGDEESYNYCFEGVPKHSVVAVSSVGVSMDDDWNGKSGELFQNGFNEMVKRLEPTKILFYGSALEGLNGDIIRIPSFYEEKRERLNEMKELKNGKRIERTRQ